MHQVQHLNYYLRSTLMGLHNRYPETMVATVEDRNAVDEILKDPALRVAPNVRTALQEAVKDAARIIAPVTQPTDYELVAYCDENSELKAKPHPNPLIGITPGFKYPITSMTMRVEEDFIKKKAQYDEVTDTWKVVDHQCTRKAQDRATLVNWDARPHLRKAFVPPQEAGKSTYTSNDLSEEALWDYFERPKVPSVKEVFRKAYDHAIDVLERHEVLAAFDYYPGQKDYIARVACKDFGVPAAQTGVGKTLVAISLMIIKEAERILVMAPKATVKGSKSGSNYDVAQWEEEIVRFAPFLKVHRIFERKDLISLLNKNGGKLPGGVFITYPDAFLTNGSDELEDSSEEAELKFCDRNKLSKAYHNMGVTHYSTNNGVERGSIRCVAKPSMLTLVGHQFDMVILDEAHVMKNPDAKRTKQFLRLQPKYRYAMTASPISNTLPDICTLMGWTAVPGWYKGGHRNAAWPFALEDRSRFCRMYMARETDHTRGRVHQQMTGQRKSFTSVSPQVSNPCALLKLLKPVMSYIDKLQCNPNIVPCEVKEVRVPFGTQQEKLYRHYLNTKNMVGKAKGNALAQQTFLRDVCCEPLSLSKKTKGVPWPGLVGSALNPKLMAMLDITRERLELGEQVLIVCSRINQSDEIHRRLKAAGVPCSRMDSTAKDVAAEARAFKKGKTRVCLMGIQMAVGHSFSNCPNLVIGSLEWTYSAKIQAMGRVWRMNSPVSVRVWCILNRDSVEELMFDKVATKEDAATLCLYGRRQPHVDVHVDASSITAEHIINYQVSGGKTISETQCEKEWQVLEKRIHDSIYNNPLVA